MPLEFRSTTPADLDRIQTLLQAAFGSGPDAPNLDAALLRWKYWEPGTEWKGSRGYLLERDGELLAHGSLWPISIRGACAAGLLDWAAVRFPPGMGVALLRRIASEIAPVLVSTGGSPATRAIMPRIGFRHVDNQSIYVRVLRPWKQSRTRPREAPPRAVGRLLRNAMWSVGPPMPLRRWTARPVSELPDSVAEHLLRCPGAVVTAWKLEHPDGDMGFFVLSRVGGQSRIARLRLDSLDPTDWKAAYALAAIAAMGDPHACEVAALSSNRFEREALVSNGFHYRDQRPVFVYDPKKHIPPEAFPLEFDMLDDDMAYLNTPEYPYFA